MQSRIKHLLKHFALVLKAKLNQLKPFVRFVFQSSTLLPSPTHRIIKDLRTQTPITLLYVSFSCPYKYFKKNIKKVSKILNRQKQEGRYKNVIINRERSAPRPFREGYLGKGPRYRRRHIPRISDPRIRCCNRQKKIHRKI